MELISLKETTVSRICVANIILHWFYFLGLSNRLLWEVLKHIGLIFNVHCLNDALSLCLRINGCNEQRFLSTSDGRSPLILICFQRCQSHCFFDWGWPLWLSKLILPRKVTLHAWSQIVRNYTCSRVLLLFCQKHSLFHWCWFLLKRWFIIFVICSLNFWHSSANP